MIIHDVMYGQKMTRIVEQEIKVQVHVPEMFSEQFFPESIEIFNVEHLTDKKHHKCQSCPFDLAIIRCKVYVWSCRSRVTLVCQFYKHSVSC